MNRNLFLVILAAIGGLFLLFLVISMLGAFALFGDKASFVKHDSIGVIKVEGIIASSEELLKQIREFKDEAHIKGVIVRLNSPGGMVGPSQEIYEALKELRSHKKVVASMGGLAASGAYYIACAAEHIVANPGTITGSIGVIMEFANLQKLYQWAKIDHEVLKSGRYKDAGSFLRPMKEDERVLLQGVVNNVYQQFRQVVLEARKVSPENVDMVTDGRIFSGEQARALGLVDDLGNFEKAVQVAATLSGIEGKPELVYPPKPKRPFVKYLLGESTVSALERLAAITDMSAPVYFLMPGYR